MKKDNDLKELIVKSKKAVNILYVLLILVGTYFIVRILQELKVLHFLKTLLKILLPLLFKTMPPTSKIAKAKITIKTSWGEPIVIGLVVFDNTPAMFGITIAESKKYAPRRSMKLPKTIG